VTCDERHSANFRIRLGSGAIAHHQRIEKTGMTDIKRPPAIRTDEIYATIDDGYGPSGVFQEWVGVDAPGGGCKIHVSVAEKSVDALMVATFVLPELRRLRVRHKIVRTFDGYASLNRGDQRGKFITIYTSGPVDRDRVKVAIDPELLRYRQVLGVRPGPRVIDRITGAPETPLGVSGFLTWRMFGPGHE
jgi:hypothetical protein